MKQIKSFLGIVAIIIGLAGFAGPAAAFELRNGREVTVQKGETVNGTLVAAGQTIVINGDVLGDIICAGQNISINGAVDGDIICAGQTVDITNSVSGSIRLVAQTIDITGPIGRNATVAAQTIKSDSQVKGEMFFASQSAAIGGRIGKDVAGAARSITLSSDIGGNAQFRDGNLILKNTAAIGGALSYVSANDAAIEAGARIANGARRYDPPANENLPILERHKKTFSEKILDEAMKLLCYMAFALAFALAFVFLFKGPATKAAAAMLVKPGRSFGIGLLSLLVTPISIVLLMITIIGIPVAMVVLLLFLVAIFLSCLLAAIAVGRKIVAKYFKGKQDSLPAQALAGVVVLWLLSLIPVLGKVLMLVAVSWGLGGIYYMFKKDKAAAQNPAAAAPN